MKPLKPIGILVYMIMLALCITSCGFKLRGSEDSPSWLKAGIAIQVRDASGAWEELLRPQLEAAHIPVLDDPKHAPYVLIIQKEQLTQNITAVSSSTTPRMYQLTYTVWFSLKNAKGKTIIKPNHVVVTRPLTINNNRVLGSHNEGEKLKKEMRDDAASKIIEFLYQKDTLTSKP